MDSLILFPPGASQLASAWASTIQLGSWLMADPGPDYGAKGLIESVEAQNALRDGGTFAYRRGVIRKMALPLMLNTPSPAGWETALRKAVTPGAIVAVQPEGVPSAQAVYFDIIDGRWEPDYNIFHNRVGVRKGTLYLDTQPWGYWPTEILLASAASIGWMGVLPVNGASVIGDVPPLAHIAINPTVASTFGSTSFLYAADMIAIGLGGRASFTPFMPPKAFNSYVTGGLSSPSLAGDKFAPASQALTFLLQPAIVGGQGWQGPITLGSYTVIGTAAANAPAMIASGLDVAFRGRFRIFAFARMSPSCAPFQMVVDAARWANTQGGLTQPMASVNQIATVYNVIPTAWGVSGPYMASPMYSMYDMGELTLPPNASGISDGITLRAWINAPAGIPTVTFSFGGLYLVPLDGAAGVIPRGLFAPSLNSGFQCGPEWNKNYVEGAVYANAQASAGVTADLAAYYRGVTPRIGASTNQLVFVTGDRTNLGGAGTSNGATYPVLQANVEFAQVSVSYRPTFQFLAGG